MISKPVYAFNELTNRLHNEGGFTVFEDHNALRILNFRCANKATLELIINFINSIAEENLGESHFVGDIYRDIDISDAAFELIEGDQFTLTHIKKSSNGFFRFFTKSGLESALNEDEFVYTAKRVWVASKFREFHSVTTMFQEWGSENPTKPYEWKGFSNPRKLARDLSNDPSIGIPDDIRPWILAPEQEILESDTLSIWESVAAKNLAYSLPCEIRTGNEGSFASFKGEKTLEVRLLPYSKIDYLVPFPALNKCAYWVFSNHQEAETKHAILNFHLSTEWIRSEDWPNKTILETSFKAAEESFRLHLYEGSKELLKAYSEIKNSLQEDVNKVAENTRGLVSNLWRDFAVAAGVLALNFATQASGLTPEGIKVIFVSAAIFLFLSIGVTVFTNHQYNKIFQQNRDAWRKRLYPFIDESNFENLVTEPINKSLGVYRTIVYITIAVYAVISGYFIYLAFR